MTWRLGRILLRVATRQKMTKTINSKEKDGNEPNLEPVSRYCKYCKEHYWNHGDCNSIRENKACVYCVKEGKNIV